MRLNATLCCSIALRQLSIGTRHTLCPRPSRTLLFSSSFCSNLLASTAHKVVRNLTVADGFKLITRQRRYLSGFHRNSNQRLFYTFRCQSTGRRWESNRQFFTRPDDPNEIPEHSDVVIIGGGAIGSCVAYFIKSKVGHRLSVCVIERDPSYTLSSTTLSLGGIRQQFSLPENLQLSAFSFDFLRNIRDHLTVYEEDPPDVDFQPGGYLFLASPGEGETVLARNYQNQRDLGAKVTLMDREELARNYPWLNLAPTENTTAAISAGCYGYEREGWFDPWLFLSALKKKNLSLGVRYVKGHVSGFSFNQDFTGGDLTEARIRNVLIQDPASKNAFNTKQESIRGALFVNAAGAWSGQVARMAGIGGSLFSNTPPIPPLSQPLPVEPRKRFFYVCHAPEGPTLSTACVCDPSGLLWRPEGAGGNFITGRAPSKSSDEPDIKNLEVDYSWFDTAIWPVLAARVPVFEKLKVINAWAGYYDYNVADQNGIVGFHPFVTNMLFATGFSGHGIMMSPGVGNAISELVLDYEFKAVDLRRLSFERLSNFNTLVFEDNIL